MVTLTATDAELIACELAKRQFVTDDGYDFLSNAWVDAGRFEPWPHLIKLAQDLQRGESQIVLKARQVGISWLLAAFAVWRMLRGDSVLIVSRGQREAVELMDKARHVYYHLPPRLAGQLRIANEMELQHASGGRILALPSTQDAGRGYTVDLVIADEAAFHPWAAQNYAAYLPTISAGGQLLMVSTANGSTGFFAELYRAAAAGQTDYHARFVAWHDRPGRDDAWLQQQRERFVGLPAEFVQEFPGTATEAFVALTGLVYPMFNRDVHIKPAPCRWEDCKRRYAGVDWGGGDPTAIVVLGVTASDRVHQYGEFYRRGMVDVAEIADYLWDWQRRGRIISIACDPSEPVAIATLRNAMATSGRSPVIAADNAKGEGLGNVAYLLESGRMTIDATCLNSIHEFDGYRWRERLDPNSKDRYATGTPVDHHADAMDARRYAVQEIMRNEVIYQREPVRIAVTHTRGRW